MVSFLFWNTRKRSVPALLRLLADAHSPDVLLLAENAMEPSVLLNSLNEGRARKFRLCLCRKPDLVALTPLPEAFFRSCHEDPRFSIFRLTLPLRVEMHLVAAHLPSKASWSQPSQSDYCKRIATAIRRAEDEAGHRRTLLVGDLNMDPFEPGLLSAEGLHAVMTRRIAMRETRKILDQEYPFFYNPMWGFFGDLTRGPAGTYYYRSSELIAQFWHLFDQVLVRPELLRHFNPDRLQILQSVGGISLIGDSGYPDSKVASDHLPVSFTLDV